MEIEKMKKLKFEAEIEIKKTIEHFTSMTGLSVCGVDLDIEQVFGAEPEIRQVRLDVRLDI